MPPEARGLLDLRPEAEFLAGHLEGAVSLPLEELEHRQHELPPKGRAVTVVDDDPARAAQGTAALQLRGYEVEVRLLSDADARVPGPATQRLWQPHALLARTVDGLGAVEAGARALDLACGSGRDAVFLAEAGFAVEAIDHLPDALVRAEDLARRRGVALRTHCRDIEADATLTANRYALISCFYFLWRPLLPEIRRALRPGGVAVLESFHALERERSGRPRRERFVYAPDELRRSFEGFDILEAGDGENPAGRYVTWIAARRPDG